MGFKATKLRSSIPGYNARTALDKMLSQIHSLIVNNRSLKFKLDLQSLRVLTQHSLDRSHKTSF